MTDLAAHLQTYFTTFASRQSSLSPHTIAAYRDTWTMFLSFLADTTNTRVDRLDFDHIDTTTVTSFLDYLENDRGNSIATRNCRLTAIRAVLTRALPHQLDHAGTLTQVLAIPPKRRPQPIVEYLTETESAALVEAPDQNRWTGRRDNALLVLALQTGLRMGVNPLKWTHQCVLSGNKIHHIRITNLEVNRCSITQSRVPTPRVVSN